MFPILLGVIACIPLLVQTASAEGDFSSWLELLRQEALAQGLTPALLDSALRDLAPLPAVLTLEQQQPEREWTLTQYLRQMVTYRRVNWGRQQRDRHRQLLDQIGQHYRVQPRFIVALWGIESDFGRNPGSTPVIPALATLAYAGRRPDFFRQELLAALRILGEGHVPLSQLVGSWAGALGQCQFMPTSFLQQAVDFDGDGRCDIWHSSADVLASIAHYLASLGWRDDHTWGREVRLSTPATAEEEGRTKDLQEWQALGVRSQDGSALPRRRLPATLICPQRAAGRSFLVYPNFHLLKKWNNSTYFALAVGLLADHIGD